MTVAATVFWEDARTARLASFGAHDLLVSCVADELARDRWLVHRRIDAIPCNGNTKLLAKLQKDVARIRPASSVCAVIDRDRAHEMWGVNDRPALCRTALRQAIRDRAPGDYGIVLLEQNMETLVGAAASLLRTTAPAKTDLERRDDVLNRLAHAPTRAERDAIKEKVPSFARIVRFAVTRFA